VSRIIRIAGYRLKDGKLVRDARRLSVSDRLRQVGSKRVRVVPPSPGEMKKATRRSPLLWTRPDVSLTASGRQRGSLRRHEGASHKFPVRRVKQTKNWLEIPGFLTAVDDPLQSLS